MSWIQNPTIPGGANLSVQYNNNGSFGGFGSFNSATNALSLPGNLSITGDLTITGDDLFMTTNTANYFLMADGTNYNPTSPADARTGLGLVAGGAGDIWVEKAGDTMTGTLNLSPSSAVSALVVTEDSTTSGNLMLVKNTGGTTMWTFNKTNLNSASAIGWTINFDTSSAVSSTTGRTGISVTMNAGYTGSGPQVTALAFDNVVLGTDTTYTNDTSSFGYRPGGMRGIGGFCRGVASGVQSGGMFLAGGSNSEAYGVWGGATITRTGGYSIGVMGVAANAAGVAIAGAFVLGSRASQPVTRATGAALLCDNSTVALDIFVAMANGVDVFTITDPGYWEFTPEATTSGISNYFIFTGPTDTGLTASTEAIGWTWATSTNKTWAAGALSLQREYVFGNPTYAIAGGASTVTTAITLTVLAAPVAGTSTRFTNPIAFRAGGDVNIGATSAGLIYRTIDVPDHTITITGTTQVTSTGSAGIYIGQITYTNSSAVTMDNLSSLYIKNAPAVAGSVTGTNKYAIFSDAGLNRFDGDGTYVFELPADATDPTGGGGAATGRIPVKIGGATKYLAYY